MSALAAGLVIMRSESPRGSNALGMALGRLLRDGDIVCLSGPLGAGKTVLARGIGAGWGARPPLTSPTYNLAHEHRRPGDQARLIHIDLYRISGPAEAPSLGLDEILYGDAIAIIEWAERLEDEQPRDRLCIDIELAAGQARTLIIRAHGERHLALLHAWRRDTDLES